MNPDLQNLIALQDIEHQIAGLQKQVTEVPTKIQNINQQLENLSQQHQVRLSRSQELGKGRRAHEGEVEMMRTKLARLKDQLMTVKTNKEYTAMLHEIQMAQDQIRGEEDKILGIMEEMEALEHEVNHSERELQSESTQLKENLHRLEASTPALEAEVNRLRDQQGLMEQRVEAELLDRYRRIARSSRGIALAEAAGELCSACHVRIRPQVYANLLRNDGIYCCDSCSRILFLR